MTEVMHCAAKQDGSYARELLDAEPWNGSIFFAPGLTGYTRALNAQTNWLEERERLLEIVGRKWEQRIGDSKAEQATAAERNRVNLAIASRWVQSDPQSALKWYRALPADGPQATLTSRTVRILRELEPRDRWLAADWFEQESAAGRGHDELVVHYARGLSVGTVDPVVEQLISLPSGDGHREAILEAYFATRDRNGTPYLRTDPDSLTRLVQASELPLEKQEPWLRKAAETPYLGARN